MQMRGRSLHPDKVVCSAYRDIPALNYLMRSLPWGGKPFATPREEIGNENILSSSSCYKFVTRDSFRAVLSGLIFTRGYNSITINVPGSLIKNKFMCSHNRLID